MTKSEIIRTSHLIAVLLFKGGNKKIADRLELKHGKPVSAERPGGGWCFLAARDAIEQALRKEFDKPKRKMRTAQE